MQKTTTSQRKLLITLSLIVLLPLLLLAWQSWKMAQNAEQLNTARFNSLVNARLNQVDLVVQNYFQEMQLKWDLLIPQWSLDTNSSRERIKNDGAIRQIFVIDPQQIRTFPPRDKQITREEARFVNRLETVWLDPAILFSNQLQDGLAESSAVVANTPVKKQTSNNYADQVAAAPAAKPRAKLSPQSSASATSSVSITESAEEVTTEANRLPPPAMASKKFSPPTSTASSKVKPDNPSIKRGWYMSHWGNDANLIYWQQHRDNSIVGIEMEPVRVKADIISRLPNTKSENTTDFAIRVLDTAGHVVYQWGNFGVTDKQSPELRRAFTHPLSSWSMEYFGTPFNQGGLTRYNVLLPLLGFGLLIAALAWFLYREQSRELRLATQRVDFVSQVSHELKTPLTNIRMYAELLEQQVEEAEQPKRYLQVITDESKRLSRLIANVLNFSRPPRIHPRTVIADEIIQQSVQHFAPSFDAKGIHIHTDLNAAAPMQTDPDLFEQILNNLLSNVEKYAANGKRVDISSTLSDSNDTRQFSLRVRDYGDGIARAERKSIFEPFYRINDKLTEGVSGTGIGLTIARQQAQHLGGTLNYVDVSPGACFELTLPLTEETGVLE